MSLITVPSSQNWVVVLKDSTRKSLVFYNQASHALALINDPREFNLYEQYDARDSSISSWSPENLTDRLNSNELVTYYRDGSSSQQTSLVPSEQPQYFEYPEYYNHYPEYEEYNQQYQSYNRFGDYNVSTTLPSVVCPECGTFVASSRLHHSSRNSRNLRNISSSSHRHHQQTQSNHASQSSQSGGTPPPQPIDTEIVRDASYFRLLEGFTPINEEKGTENEHNEPVSQPANPLASSSTISSSALSEGYFAQFFRVVAYLGRGSRGSVYLVEHLLDGYSLGLFALKKVPVGDDHKWLEKVLIEVNLLRLLSHPNLVNYNHMWLENAQMSRFSPKVPCAFILQEYCDGGTLEDYVNNLQKEARMQKMKKEIQGSDVNNKTKQSSAQVKRERYKRATLDNNSNNANDHLTGQENTSLHGNSIIAEARLTLREILFFSKDIFAGVAHLHRAQIIHRDLKPLNCLLLSKGKRETSGSSTPLSNNKFTVGDDGKPIDLGDGKEVPGLEPEPVLTYEQRTIGPLPTVLVSDFGEGQREGILRTGTGATGTLEYCAPELIAATHLKSSSDGKAQPELAQFSRKTDMFSLGMILYFLIFSRLPYPLEIIDNGESQNIEKLREAVSKFEGLDERLGSSECKRDDIPQELGDMLKRLLSRDPKERPEAGECLNVIEKLLKEFFNEDNSTKSDASKEAKLRNNDEKKESEPTISERKSLNQLKDKISQSPRASIRLISDISIADAQYANYYPVYNESFFINDRRGLSKNSHRRRSEETQMMKASGSDTSRIVNRITDESSAVNTAIGSMSSAMVPFEGSVGVPSIAGSSVSPFPFPDEQDPFDIYSKPQPSDYGLFRTNSGSYIEEISESSSEQPNNVAASIPSFSAASTPQQNPIIDRGPTGLVQRRFSRLDEDARPGFQSSLLVLSECNRARLQGLLQDKFRNAVPPRPTRIIGHSLPSDASGANSYEASRVASADVSRRESESRTFGKSVLTVGEKRTDNGGLETANADGSNDGVNFKQAYTQRERKRGLEVEGPGNKEDGVCSSSDEYHSDREGSKRQRVTEADQSQLEPKTVPANRKLNYFKPSFDQLSADSFFERSGSRLNNERVTSLSGSPSTNHTYGKVNKLGNSRVSKFTHQSQTKRQLKRQKSYKRSSTWTLRLVLVKGILFLLKIYILKTRCKGGYLGVGNGLDLAQMKSHSGLLTKTPNGTMISPNMASLLILLSGIEIPLGDVRVSVALFVVHIGLVYGTSGI